MRAESRVEPENVLDQTPGQRERDVLRETRTSCHSDTALEARTGRRIRGTR